MPVSCKCLGVALCLATLPVSASAQAYYPPISGRTFTSGSIDITVTGAFTMNATVAINKQASFGDGEMTWLQFGIDAGAAPNALITYTTMGEVGIIVQQGLVKGVTGIGGNEKPWCTGKLDVKPKMLTGDYTCVGVPSHDKATDKMGKVNIAVKFTAGS
jgi:hypothetical protein